MTSLRSKEKLRQVEMTHTELNQKSKVKEARSCIHFSHHALHLKTYPYSINSYCSVHHILSNIVCLSKFSNTFIYRILSKVSHVAYLICSLFVFFKCYKKINRFNLMICLAEMTRSGREGPRSYIKTPRPHAVFTHTNLHA